MIDRFVRLAARGAAIDSSECRNRCGSASGIMGIGFNLVLFFIKLFAGLLAGSTAILADAFNNLSDIGSSVITFIGFKMAAKPADEDHPFGHGRIEYISGIFVSVVILIMGFELAKSSIEKIISPTEVSYTYFTVIILSVSIAVKLFMFFVNRGVSGIIDSSALRATAADSLNDSIATAAVLCGIGITRLFSINIDGMAGLAVAVFIFVSGIRTMIDTINPVLGEAADPEMVKRIEAEVLKHEQVLGIHDLIIHNYGPARLLLSFHAEVPSTGNVLELHDIIDNIERELKSKLGCDAVIHMDPIVIDDERTNTMRKRIATIVRQIDGRITMHDFRMTDGHTHTNLIFDVVVPYKMSISDKELISQIQDRLNDADDTYFVCVNIDREY